MDNQAIKDLVLFMAEQGVASFEVDQIRVSFDPRAFKAKEPAPLTGEQLRISLAKIQELQEKAKKDEEELLYASAE